LGTIASNTFEGTLKAATIFEDEGKSEKKAEILIFWSESRLDSPAGFNSKGRIAFMIYPRHIGAPRSLNQNGI
jgi:hypothetical protein